MLQRYPFSLFRNISWCKLLLENRFPTLDPIDPIPPRPPQASSAVEPARPSTGENPVFNLVDVLLIVLVAVFSLIFCGTVAVILVYAAHPFRGDVREMATNVLLFLPAQVAAYCLTVGFMVALVWQKYRTGFLTAVRWNMPKPQLAWGAVALGALLGLTSQVAAGLLQRWIPKSLPIEQYFRTPASAYALAAFGILVAPVVEELFFRGFLYPALARPLGSVPAIALTAGGFALLHSEQLAHAWVPLLMLFAVGAVLTVVRARTKSVATTVLIHMGYNLTLFALLFYATDGFRHMERG